MSVAGIKRQAYVNYTVIFKHCSLLFVEHGDSVHKLRKLGKLHAGKLYTSLTSVVLKQNPSCIFQLLPFVGEDGIINIELLGEKRVTMKSLAWQPITRFDRCIAGREVVAVL